MKRLANLSLWTLVFAIALSILTSGCKTPSEFSSYELEYRLLSNFSNIFWCDPDLYPIARPGQEQTNALEQFPAIRANSTEFSAILQHLSLRDQTNYSDVEKLEIYREHKKLSYAVQISPSGDIYNFTLRTTDGQGESITGTITKSGTIKVLQRETSFITCPICLANGTLISTPDGLVPVEQIRQGMTVWTVDVSGKRVAAVVIATSQTGVPTSFRMVRITLVDGRVVTASPGHPTTEGKPLADYQVGDMLDGALILTKDYVDYDGDATYDLLPSGDTGFYWANGILLKSTLAAH